MTENKFLNFDKDGSLSKVNLIVKSSIEELTTSQLATLLQTEVTLASNHREIVEAKESNISFLLGVLQNRGELIDDILFI